MSARRTFTNSKGAGATSGDKPKPSWRDKHQATDRSAPPARRTQGASYSAGASYSSGRSSEQSFGRDSAPAGGGSSRFKRDDDAPAARYSAADARSSGPSGGSGYGGGSSNRFSRGDDRGGGGGGSGYGQNRSMSGFQDNRRSGGGGYGDRFGGGRGRQEDSGQLEEFSKSFYKEDPKITAMSEEEIDVIKKKLEIVVEGKDVPRPLTTFEQAGFPEKTMSEIYSAGFPSPSPIQCQAWPMALSGRDCIGIAQTGSGKTLSFLLPGVVHIMAQPGLRRGDGPIGLVLSPTRELAIQINEECKRFSAGLRVTCVYGGAPKYDQKRDLRNGVEIVIATPGRLMDFIDSRDLRTDRVTYLVMDEADRMLDMGFEPQIRAILGTLRDDRQTLMFSATWPRGVERLAADYMSGDVIKVTIGSEELTANKKITQRVELIDGVRAKEDRLFEILMDEVGTDKVLIFAGTKRMCNDLEHTLNTCNVYCAAIHGDKSQQEREAALHDFKAGNTQIMVGTDVAARGIHVDDIAWVINYDFPQQVEDYIHRIGRTGRAGKTGKAVTFFSHKNARHADQLIEILQEANQQVPEGLRQYAANQCGQRSNRRSNFRDRNTAPPKSGFGNFGGGGYAPGGFNSGGGGGKSSGGGKKKVDRSAW